MPAPHFRRSCSPLRAPWEKPPSACGVPAEMIPSVGGTWRTASRPARFALHPDATPPLRASVARSARSRHHRRVAVLRAKYTAFSVMARRAKQRCKHRAAHIARSSGAAKRTSAAKTISKETGPDESSRPPLPEQLGIITVHEKYTSRFARRSSNVTVTQTPFARL
jgi:hypothetical protein